METVKPAKFLSHLKHVAENGTSNIQVDDHKWQISISSVTMTHIIVIKRNIMWYIIFLLHCGVYFTKW